MLRMLAIEADRPIKVFLDLIMNTVPSEENGEAHELDQTALRENKKKN